MSEDDTLIHARLKTPKAAALAGIAFSLLMFTIFGLLRRSIPADPLESGAWLTTDTKAIALALNLIPFAGVAFLWFIGVLRDRLGRQEDRFFATVFFGSALLYLAMLCCGDRRGYAGGGRFHDFNVNCCDLRRHRSALDCLYRVFVGVGAADRQLLYRVEFRGIAGLGAFDQRTYFS
jgi:MFS family permease